MVFVNIVPQVRVCIVRIPNCMCPGSVLFQAGLILEMISHDRTSRPSAAEILARLDGTTAGTGSNDNPARSEVSDRVATDVDGNSQHSVAELLSIIEDLRRQVAAKDLLIEQLTNQQ